MRVAWIAVSLLVGCCQAPAPDGAPGAPRASLAMRSRPRDAGVLDPASARTSRQAAPDPAVELPIDAPDGPTIIDAPIAWTEARARLTLAYRRAHGDPDATDLVIEPRAIVLHYTGGGSARATRRYFDRPTIEPGRAALRRAGAANVSAHYLVDRDGTIYRLQPDTRFARHCIGLNHLAIGVENVGDGARWPLTDAQLAANAALVRALARTHRITHLLGHHEVMGMRAHAYYVERDPTYRNRKPDPGAAFMTRVRAAVADLALAGPEG